MHHSTALALARSQNAYSRDWPQEAKIGVIANADTPLRVFDISDWLDEAAENNREKDIQWLERHGSTDLAVLGRALPFDLFVIVLGRQSQQGVIVVRGNEDEGGLYAYCDTSKVPTLVAEFVPGGWKVYGVIRRDGGTPELRNHDDKNVSDFLSAFSLALQVVEVACADTRYMVSYRLNRAERRAAQRENAVALDSAIIHHVCLDGKSRERITRERGATVVATPKRLHEVRAHWRRLRTGVVTRVKSHRRGKRGTTLQPRVYSVAGANLPNAVFLDRGDRP